MSDTRQVVSWSLERKCCFRNGADWFLPTTTQQHLANLRMVASAIAGNRVVDGICVTSWRTGKDNSGNYHDLPYDGFRMYDRLGDFGGLTAIQSTCGECEANAVSSLETRIAGCFGSLDIWPDSPELEAQLWDNIAERGLEDRLRSAFKVTAPLWYGFWIESPLRRNQAELLYELFDAACDRDDPEEVEVVHFLNALKVAINWELPVHVSMAPLGHTDLGWYTIFPHCPLCKANAPVGRWKDEFPDEPYQCKVCSHVFNPNEHHSSERDDDQSDATSLLTQLGEEECDQFTRRFLLHRGCDENQANEVIDNANSGPLLRKIAAVRQKRNRTLQAMRNERRVPATTELTRNFSVALNDDVELEFVLIPAGEFRMGTADADEYSNESPQHIVRFERPFFIARFPITQAQWQAIMGPTEFRTTGPNLPVDQVSWLDCQDFCEELCNRQHRVFRLPSEAEWEYTCRAGTSTKYAFGYTLTEEMANFTPYNRRFGSLPLDELQAVREAEERIEAAGDNLTNPKAGITVVGTYSPNAWGIYDMHGNVAEWCEDVWHDKYDGAPIDGSAWLSGEDKQPFRVARGGWCSATEFVCTSASRRQLRADAGQRKNAEPDEDEDEDGFLAAMFEMMYTPNGFRVVCEL